MAAPPHDFAHDPRPLARALGKPPEAWQRRDLLQHCLEAGIRVLNLRYPGLDGKLRELRIPVTGRAQLDRVLAAGERVDGSSLFPGLFRSTESDLYVVPVYRWAFRNPWASDELDIVCRYAARDGSPCPLTPDNILAAAAEDLREATGAELEALAEVEFYLMLRRDDDRFTGKAQRNYHQAQPYLHGRPIADDILRAASSVFDRIKYCHAEVGYVDRIESEDPEIHGRRAEQFELEMSLMPVTDLGTWLAVCRWLIRVAADLHGASATFVPKLEPESAGSGMHLHLAVKRDGVNTMLDERGELSADALGLVGGLLGEVSALTAFGNTVAASYSRLVPGHEAPTHVCWGRHNRSSLIRVPLHFLTECRLDHGMNPAETGEYPELRQGATVEYRSPDGTAFAQLLLAGVALAVREGLAGAGAKRARELEAPPGAPHADGLERLPASAAEAADRLQESRSFFEKGGFPPQWIDLVIGKLRAENDRDLGIRLENLPAAERHGETLRILHKDLHKR